MPFVDLPNMRIHYALSGDRSLPALVLSNSLGTNLSMWDLQAPPFEKSFRLLRYDMRGHGQSSVPPPPYSVSELAADVLSLVDSLGIDRFHFCGLSVGGMIGMSLALKAPERLEKLVAVRVVVAPHGPDISGRDHRHCRKGGTCPDVGALDDLPARTIPALD